MKQESLPADLIEVKTGTLTLVSGLFTNVTYHLKKTGKVVTLSFNAVSRSSEDISTNTIIATIPSEYKPINIAYGVGLSTTEIFGVIASSSGNLKLSSLNGSKITKEKWVEMSMTWITA